MVKIQQHGPLGELFDMAAFLVDIDRFGLPDSWQISVEWCLGLGADAIENASASGLCLTDSEFRILYLGIYQTVDGKIVAFRRGEPVFEFIALDSSYWGIAGPPEFEAHMLLTYGAWTPRH